ncbi:MAG TPA: hypothetical protein VFR38_09030 [Gaiellaceae bacterium]|nr:hypothetical protein [Gaiellaceae bacterium]
MGLAIAAATVWVLAGIVDDGLYTISGLLGAAGFASGLKGRREAKRAGLGQRLALTAIILGGLLGAAFVVAFAAWGVYHLVT